MNTPTVKDVTIEHFNMSNNNPHGIGNLLSYLLVRLNNENEDAVPFKCRNKTGCLGVCCYHGTDCMQNMKGRVNCQPEWILRTETEGGNQTSHTCKLGGGISKRQSVGGVRAQTIYNFPYGLVWLHCKPVQCHFHRYGINVTVLILRQMWMLYLSEIPYGYYY